MRNVKTFKNLDEQIKYLRESKKVEFDDVEDAKDFLLANNYYNVVSAAKLSMCCGYDAVLKKHIYQRTNFDVWVVRYLDQQKFGFQLLENLLVIEKTLNSRLAYYLSEMIELNIISNQKEKDKIKNFIDNTIYWSRNLSTCSKKYCFNNTWEFVTAFTFGETIRLIKKIKEIKDNRKKFKLNDFEIDKYLLLILDGNKISKLEEINLLRNTIAHNTPIAIYITSTDTKTNMINRLDLVKEISEGNHTGCKAIQHEMFSDFESVLKKYINARYT